MLSMFLGVTRSQWFVSAILELWSIRVLHVKAPVTA
jgi:hypothetical protein